MQKPKLADRKSLLYICAAILLLIIASGAVFLDEIRTIDRTSISASALQNNPDHGKSKFEEKDKYSQIRKKAIDNGSVRIIVKLKTNFVPEGNLQPEEMKKQRGSIKSKQDQILKVLKFNKIKSVKTFEGYIPFMAMSVDADALEKLVNIDDVISIYEDTPVPVNLEQSIPIIGADNAWTSGYTGNGQTVAVLDTGVDSTHPFLAGKVVSEACFSTTDSTQGASSTCPNGQEEQIGIGSGVNCDTLYVGCDHGTHVAGIIAGNESGDPGITFNGVAKDANIISIQVFSTFPTTICIPLGFGGICAMSFTSDQIQGLTRVYELRNDYDIAAVNTSLGGGEFLSPCVNEAQEAAIDLLYSVGIATIASSGNSYNSDKLSSPACIQNVISVGATDDVDSIPTFSDSAYFLDFLAPGVDINSSVPGGSYVLKSGTSMAAPHVAGAWAILKEAVPTASIDQIKLIMAQTGINITDSRNGLTKPRIQIDNAVNSLIINDAPFDLELSNYSVSEGIPSGSSVGHFLTSDIDLGDAHTYLLVAGEGDSDNGNFTINGNQLETTSIFDYETKNSYSIRVRSTDNGVTPANLYVEKQFVINIDKQVNTFPWSEDFENGGTIPDYWVNDQNDSYNNEDWLFSIPYYGADYDHTYGDNAHYIAWLDDSSLHEVPANLLTPSFDITSLSQPALSFWYWINNRFSEPLSELHIDIYDGINWNNSVFTISGNNTWNNYSVNLSPYKSNNTKIRFRGIETNAIRVNANGTFYSSSSDISLDDVSIFDNIQSPNCSEPAFPGIGEIVEQLVSGELRWSGSPGASGYKLYFGTDGGGISTPTNIVNGQDLGDSVYYNYSNLDSNVMYYWEIIPYNFAGSATGCSIWNFSTQSAINSFPFFEDFEEAGNLPAYWVNDNMDSGENWYIDNDSSGVEYGAGFDHTYKDSSHYYAWVDDSIYDEQPTNLLTPTLDISALSSPILTFWYWIGAYTPESKLVIDVFNGTTWVENVIEVSGTTQWERASIDLLPFQSSKSQIKFRAMESSHYKSDIALDDVAVFDSSLPLGCSIPKHPLAGATDVLEFGTLEWFDVMGATGYKLYFGTDGNGLSDPIEIENATDLGEVILYNYSNLNLSHSTEHYWKIVPYSDTQEATGCDILSFTIRPGMPQTFPYSEGFENGGSIPDYWFNDETDTARLNWTFNKALSYSGIDHTYRDGNHYIARWTRYSGLEEGNLISPAMDLTSLLDARLSLWYWIEQYGIEKLYIDVHDGTTWINNLAVVGSGNTWQELIVDINPYKSTKNRIRFRAAREYEYGSSGDVFLDDVTIYDNTEPPPECPLLNFPGDATINQPVQGTLDWFNSIHTAGYKMYFGTDGEGISDPINIENATDLGNILSYTYSNISYESVHYWKVTPYNENGDNTNCQVREFTTAPLINVFPWSTGFEEAGNIPYGMYNDKADSGEDWLFSKPGNGTDPARYGANYDHTFGDNSHYIAWVDDTSPNLNPTNLILPDMDISGLTTPYLSFWYWIGTGTPNSILYIDIFDGINWNNGVISVTGNNQWDEGIIDLAGHKSNKTRIRFRAEEGTSYYSDISLDDVLVQDTSAPPPCSNAISPTNGQIGVALNGDLNWSPVAGNVDGYKIYFGTDGGGTVDPINIENETDMGLLNTYAYSNLSYESMYYWKIVPYNVNGNAIDCSIWSFTTLLDPRIDTFPWIEDFENEGNLPQNWLNDNTDSTGDWMFAKPGIAGSNPAQYGANYDHTFGDNDHYIAWIDDSTPETSPVNLITPPLDLSTLLNPQLSFWYWIGVYTPGSSLYVDVFDGYSWTEGIVSVAANGQWSKLVVDLTSYKTTLQKIRFRGMESTSFRSDICLDDVKISELNYPPAPSAGSIPADGETKVSAMQKISWMPGVDPENDFLTYNLYFDTNPTPTTLVASGTSDNFYQPVLFNYNQTYYWRVDITDTEMNTTTGTIWNFTTETSPDAECPGLGILCNPSFEFDDSYWTANGDTNMTISSDSQDGLKSISSEQIRTSAQNPRWSGFSQSNVSGFAAGGTYNLQLHAKGTNITQGHVKIKWYDGGSSLITTTYPLTGIEGTIPNWTWYNRVFTVPNNAVTADFIVWHGVTVVPQNFAGSTLMVDKIIWKEATEYCGTVCNENFEAGLLFWTQQGKTGSNTVVIGGAKDGTRSARSAQLYTSSDPLQWTGIRQTAEVTEGQPYRLRVWFKTLNAVNGHVRVTWKNAQGTDVSTIYPITGLAGTNSIWFKKESILIPPAGATKAEIIIIHGVTGGSSNAEGSTIWIDNITMICDSLCNGGFENGMSDWGINGYRDVSAETANVQEGTNAVLLEQDATNADNVQWSGISQRLMVSGGSTYDLSLWLKKLSAVGGHVKVTWRDIDDNFISNSFPASGIEGTDMAWTQYQSQVTAPVNADTAEIFVWHGVKLGTVNMTGSRIWVDDVRFSEVL